jgi:hypothetical protein
VSGEDIFLSVGESGCTKNYYYSTTHKMPRN